MKGLIVALVVITVIEARTIDPMVSNFRGGDDILAVHISTDYNYNALEREIRDQGSRLVTFDYLNGGLEQGRHYAYTFKMSKADCPTVQSWLEGMVDRHKKVISAMMFCENKIVGSFRIMKVSEVVVFMYVAEVVIPINAQGDPWKSDRFLGKRIEHINEFAMKCGLLKYKPNDNVTVTVTIRDAECFSASTVSSFTIYLAAIDFDNRFQSWMLIESEDFNYDPTTGTRYFSDSKISPNLYGAKTLDDCFEKGYIDCAPRADAVFIKFDNQPQDAWAIDQIFVNTNYRLGPTEEHEQSWHFEHPILMPCSSWLDSAATYQIGPRNGLFIRHEYRYKPSKDDWIRDWV
ncbi:hypothetical protein V3C99_010768 [Haemonchus contortus]